jgi:transposase
MRKIREVLRLCLAEGLSARQASSALGVPRQTINRYLRQAEVAGMDWPRAKALDDLELEQTLFRPAGPLVGIVARPLPEFGQLHLELKRKDVTLQLLWMEYRERHPDGYQYSQFCEHYRRWQNGIDVVMRQEHRAGERCFVDYAGPTVPIVDPRTGEITQAEIFVAVLGASSYTYAEACPSQELPHWIAAHVHAFEYFGGSTAILVPDNLKSGITRAHRYEPEINATYAELAAHYGCAVLPARSRKPRDKAKVEAGVLLVERWILARLRHRTFFSLAELNAAIKELLVWLNARPFKKLAGSRQSLYEELERPALRALPARPYEFAVWRTAKVSIDYHVDVLHHYYSVPHRYVGEQVDVRLAVSTVEILLHGRRIASHLRSDRAARYTTEKEHMPASHRAHLEWTPERIVRWAEETGPHTAALARGILESRPHPEQGYRSCLGILRLGRRYGAERLEAAARRALAVRSLSYRSVESILKNGLDRQPLPASAPASPAPLHDNLRGPTYYR